MTPKPAPGARCVAPSPDAPASVESILCGKPATELRFAGGMACPLCSTCAAEFDAERPSARRPRRTHPSTQTN